MNLQAEMMGMVRSAATTFIEFSIRWLGLPFERKEQSPPPDPLRFLWPSLNEWAGEWREEGKLNLYRIDEPNWIYETDTAKMVRGMMEWGDYTGIKQWWFERLKGQEGKEVTNEPASD